MNKGSHLITLLSTWLGRLCCLVAAGGGKYAFAEPVELVFQGGQPTSTYDDWFSLFVWALVCLICVVVVSIGVIIRQKSTLDKTIRELSGLEEGLQEAQSIAQMGSWSRDFEHGTTFWSKEARMVLGLGDDQEAFKHYETLLHPDDIEGMMEAVAAAYHQGGGYIHEHRIISPLDNKERWVRLAGKVFLGEEESPVRETGTVQDVTLRRAAELALRQSEEKLRSILEAAPYPIMIFDISSAPSLLYANQSTYYLFELDQDEGDLNNIDLHSLWVDEDAHVEFTDSFSEGGVTNLEVLMKTNKGKVFWGMLSSTSMDFQGNPALFISVLDITDRKLIQEELERLATTDTLTGLLNRRSIFETANKEIRRAIRYQYPFTIIMLDIDHFKRVNDTYGHATGDRVIQLFAEVCLSCLREEDSLGRVGGEEFVAVLVSSTSEGGRVVAERMREAWEATEVEVPGGVDRFTVSIGVSELIVSNESFDVLLERADRALYVSKSAGRNRVTIDAGAATPVN
ncbi:hypothetical protein A9Q81_01935 [Gammaproteobacteria bacterium 42_54_T18]|nr:hypothetical protein A9Q81_01935 [Gammaproteobacteria bacterium 42_54_T18]